MKKLSGVLCVFCSVILLGHLLFSAFSVTVFAEHAQSDLFTEKLFGFGEIKFSYAVPQEYTNSITSKTGTDDYFKTRFATGDSISSYSAGSQLFENGRYEKGSFIYDQKALASHISEALEIYRSLEDKLTGNECARIRSIIAYGYSKLSAEGRISIENTPGWLLADMGDSHIKIQEEIRIFSDSGDAPLLFTDGLRKINAESEGYRNTVVANTENCDVFSLKVPENAEMFSAVLGIPLGEKAFDVLVKITPVDSMGRAINQSSVYLYPSYEIPVCMTLEGCNEIRFEIIGKVDKVLLCDPIFMKKGSESFSAQRGNCSADKFGDINCDGIISPLDIQMLKNAVVSNTVSDFERCDISRDRVLDYYDVLSLENYIIFLANRYREFTVKAPGIKVLVVSDRDSAVLTDKMSEYSKISIALDSFREDEFFDLLSDSDRGLAKSIENSGLVILSAGLDAFEKAVTEHFENGLSAKISDLCDIPHVLAKYSYSELCEFFGENSDCSVFEEIGRQYACQMLSAMQKIREINPETLIVVTKVPAAFASSKLCYKMQIPGVASFENEICSFDTVGERWLSTFSKELESQLKTEDRVFYADLCENSGENSLMQSLPKVYLNNLQKDDFSELERFDIGLSPNGESVLAREICSLLSDSIQKWQSELVFTPSEKLPYKFSDTFADKNINVKSKASALSANEILYTLTLDETNGLQNLFVNIAYDSQLLEFENVECIMPCTAQGTAEAGTVRILYDGSQAFSKNLEINVTFRIRPTDGENELEFSARVAESRMTNVGHSKAFSNDVLKVRTAELREELSKNSTDDAIDIFENSSLKDSGRLIVYTVFALAFAVVAVCMVFAFKSADKSKK